MNDPTRRWVFLGVAVAIAVASAFVIVISITALRDRSNYRRSIREIERSGATRERLLTASVYARGESDWTELLRFAWDAQEDWRWATVRDLALRAAEELPGRRRWRLAATYASLRGSQFRVAGEHLPALSESRDPSRLHQILAVLTAIESERHGSIPESAPESAAIARSVGIALTDPTPEHLHRAWQHARVTAFGVNAALTAAAEGQKDVVDTTLAELRSQAQLPSPEREAAPLYLALWLREVDWLFEQLRTLTGPRAVEPNILSIQAEGHLQQGRLEQARRFYREIQETDPEYSPRAFSNDAAITFRLQDGEPTAILRRGLDHHPDSARLRSELAGLLVRRSRRIDAIQVVRAPEVSLESASTPDHRDWLLLRAVVGRRTPLAALESDLWEYVNDHPDADVVAHYLARFLSARGDMPGLSQLASRYPPDRGEWSTTMHLRVALHEGRTAEAEDLADSLTYESWTAWFNRSLFALRYLPTAEVETRLREFERNLNRAPRLTPDEERDARIAMLVLQGEFHRTRGQMSEAREHIEQAISLDPDRADLVAYLGVLADP
jgi:tetratricopeptide (TPR) repeat protein